jgi:maltose/moltooligosaccharide transporter
MGMYMGLFNMSITIPQIVSGITTGLILKYWFNDNPILCIVMAGVSFLIASGLAMKIKEERPLIRPDKRIGINGGDLK